MVPGVRNPSKQENRALESVEGTEDDRYIAGPSCTKNRRWESDMDLIRQPPRRASNVNMAGIVGLARMTDKARGHNAELLGDYRYGAGSGLDVEVLEFINMNEEEFAEAADELSDADLGTLARECSGRAQADIDEFNREHLEREPQDDLHRQLLNERLDKFAPGRIDITTVFASMELDDWG
ncbi:uncharacterized protein METZ01_LOCUS392527, partial [marine metagenome]